MDTQVIRDIADHDESAPVVARERAESVSSVRRFHVDPASSPMLLAALAWDTARTRR